jgi:hypothetical protein
LGQRGTITLPKALRAGLGENTLFRAIRRDDGVIELRPQAAIDASQAWFWTERWQQMEREADEDIAAGRYRTFDNLAEFIADLEQIAAETHPPEESS